jgi:hypothetical protein
VLIIDFFKGIFERELLAVDRSLHFRRFQFIDFCEDVFPRIVPFRPGKWAFHPFPERFFHDLIVPGEGVDGATCFVGGDIFARLLFGVLIIQTDIMIFILDAVYLCQRVPPGIGMTTTFSHERLLERLLPYLIFP